jgi:hypothetical protein
MEQLITEIVTGGEFRKIRQQTKSLPLCSNRPQRFAESQTTEIRHNH